MEAAGWAGVSDGEGEVIWVWKLQVGLEYLIPL